MVGQPEYGLGIKEDSSEKEDDCIRILRDEDGHKGTRFAVGVGLPPPHTTEGGHQPIRTPSPTLSPVQGRGQDGPGWNIDRVGAAQSSLSSSRGGQQCTIGVSLYLTIFWKKDTLWIVCLRSVVWWGVTMKDVFPRPGGR